MQLKSMKKGEALQLSLALAPAPDSGRDSGNDKATPGLSPARRCRSDGTDDATSTVKRLKQEQTEVCQEQTKVGQEESFRGRSRERVSVKNGEPPSDVSLMGWEVKSTMPKRK